MITIIGESDDYIIITTNDINNNDCNNQRNKNSNDKDGKIRLEL